MIDMLNEHQIELLPERIYQRLNRINTECLVSIGEVIKEIGELRPKDVHQLQQLYNYGADVDRIVKELAAADKKNIAEIYEIFDIVAKENYNYSEPFYKAKNKPFIPYEENETLQRYVKSLAKQTVDEYVNLTQHTAFAVFDEDKKSIAPLFEANKNKAATSLSETYTRLVDYAVSKAQIGVTDYNSAISDLLEACAKSGIKTVDYATGYTRRLDTAVRQNVLWGIKECNQNTADFIGEDFGANGYEVSYHSHPRPEHADMGGKQYAKGEARTVKGVEYPSFEEEAEPLLKDFGCLHFKFSILLGISEPAYSKEQLEEFKENDKKTFEFEGEEYTGFKATQKQRKIESAIRNQKDLANIAKAAGNDALRRKAQYKINLLASKYDKFSKAADLPTKMERMNVKGFRSVRVDKSRKRDIINILPGADNVNINPQKFTAYALNPLKDENKARAFKEALGYTTENANDLIENIRDNIKNFNSVEKPDNGYGTRYEILMTLTGANGKKANVKTAWISDKNTGETRLTSAYVTKKKIKED